MLVSPGWGFIITVCICPLNRLWKLAAPIVYGSGGSGCGFNVTVTIVPLKSPLPISDPIAMGVEGAGIEFNVTVGIWPLNRLLLASVPDRGIAPLAIIPRVITTSEKTKMLFKSSCIFGNQITSWLDSSVVY